MVSPKPARCFEGLTSKENARSALPSGLRVVTRRPQRYKALSNNDLCDRKWRRRESNPEDDRHSALENTTFCERGNGLAADWQRLSCHFGNVSECDLQVIRELHLLHLTWPQLPAKSRSQILNDIHGILLPQVRKRT